MKKIISLVLFLTISIAALQTQILTPSTYSYTQKVYGEEKLDEITSVFIFTGGSEVIWCLETHDNFVYPIGFGTYNKTNATITFSATHSLNKKLAIYDGGNSIVFKVKNTKGNIQLSTNNDNGTLNAILGDASNGITLTKEKFNLKPSKELVGKGYRYDRNDGRRITLYFRSENEVVIDGVTRGYVCVGNTVGIITGDNPLSEANVCKIIGDTLEMHRSGVEKKEYTTFTLKLQE